MWHVLAYNTHTNTHTTHTFPTTRSSAPLCDSRLHLRNKMHRFQRFNIVEHRPSFSVEETSIFTPPKTLFQSPCFRSFPIFEDELDHTVDLVSFPHPIPTLFDEFDPLSFTALNQIEKTSSRTSTRHLTRRVGPGELHLQTLCDRVSSLELDLERLLSEKRARKKKIGERKYTWTTEIERPKETLKYEWMAEIKDGKSEKKGLEKSYKWTAQIKGKGSKYLPTEQTYTVKVQSRDSSSESEYETEKKKDKKRSEKVKEKGKSAMGSTARIVEIEEPSGNGDIILRKIFARRLEKIKGKRNELSPQDAAALIQMSFRSHLIRRSQDLRALRELAVAKNKLRGIRASFNNFSYHRRLSINPEERQRFSEKIIVLLLNVDAIEGFDLMVRAAKKSMVDELEAMLDVVDPQTATRPMLVKRRKFDMPDGVIDKELADGVAQMVQILDQVPSGSDSFEACF
ncbi:hypothetical protein OROGR_016021 [Orobanche gracilis]